MGFDYGDVAEVRGMNVWKTDTPGRALLAERWQGASFGEADAALSELGELTGTLIDEQAEYSDRYAPPRLESHDRDGQPANVVRYNPLYEEARRRVYSLGVVGRCYGDDALPPMFHFASVYVICQADTGLACPVTLTGATAHIVARYGTPDQRQRYLPGLAARDDRPFLGGATWVTEVQGGSDVGAVETEASATDDGDWMLTGEKWFCSNADSDVALVTARPAGAEPGTKGLGLYIVPRVLPDGRMNDYRIRRLKDKLGTVSLATGEVELFGAKAEQIAPPPQGFRLMMEALQFSRIDNAFGSAGLMRRAFLEAIIHASKRRAFGAALVTYPMVQETLLTMQADWEAGLLLAIEAGVAWERWLASGSSEDEAWQRLVTALAKHRTADDAVRNASRAVEMLGGNGYVEDFPTARLLRDAQVTPVWEGPANIQALEAMRTMGRRYGAERLFARRVQSVLEQARSYDGTDRVVTLLERELAELGDAWRYLAAHPAEAVRHARRLAEWMADVLQTTLMLEQALPELAEGDARTLALAGLFAESRIDARPGRRVGPGMEWMSRHFDVVTRHEQLPVGELLAGIASIA